MPNETEIDALELSIKSNAKEASSGLEKLISTLESLERITKNGLGLEAVEKRLESVKKTADGMNDGSFDKLDRLSETLDRLSNIGNLKISSSFATEIVAIDSAASKLNNENIDKLAEFSDAMRGLEGIGNKNIGQTLIQLKKIPDIASGIAGVDMTTLKNKTEELKEALSPLADMPKQNISSTLTQLKKIPAIATELESMDMGSFAQKIDDITDSLRPLAEEAEKISKGFDTLPKNIQKVISSSDKLNKTNTKTDKTLKDIYSTVKKLYRAADKTVESIMGLINETNDYIENMNLFTVSMGQFADEAKQYADIVSDVMGINPSEWVRNQGVFMTLATGFGIASDRAYTMSQQLTQLGYDLASFFNIDYSVAMQKLQSGISGELEPLRRLGFDLSQAKLQSVALSLGIDKTISSMTQAEKAQIRYYAIMTQVTSAQGDMARTLESPANMLRIFDSKLKETSQSLGKIFIPSLQSVLPYGIAVLEVIKELADTVATLVGFEFPEFDYSGIDVVTGGAEDAGNAFENADKSAQKLKNTIFGFDELNVMNGNNSNALEDITDGFDFELPTYEFISKDTETKIKQIKEKIKSWLGIDGEIKTWDDLWSTKLGGILKTVENIGAGLGAWVITDKVINSAEAFAKSISTSSDKLSTVDKISKGAGGIISVVFGFKTAYDGGQMIGESEKADFLSYANTALGVLESAIGGAKIGSFFGPGGAAIGASIGLGLSLIFTIAGIFKGEEKSLEEKFWESDSGKQIKELEKMAESANKYVAEMKIKLDLITGEIDEKTLANWELGNTLLDKIFTLNDKDNKTVSEFETLTRLVKEFNGLGLGDIQLQFDNLTGKITQSREEIDKMMQKLLDQYKLEAVGESYKEAYKKWFEMKNSDESAKLQEKLIGENYIVEKDDRALKTEQYKLKKLEDELDAYLNENYAGFTNKGYAAINRNDAEYYRIQRKITEQRGKVKEAEGFLNLSKENAAQAQSELDEYYKTLNSFYDKYTLYEAEFLKLSTEGENIGNEIADGLLDGAENIGDIVDNGIIAPIEDGFETIYQYIDKFSGGKFKGFNVTISEIPAIYTAPKTLSASFEPVSIGQYSGGGIIDTGDLFIANENGAELVGTIGNKTAVANNQQIIEGIKQGVKEAMLESGGNANGGDITIQIVKNGVIESETTVTAAQRLNKRAGKTIIPLGV